MDEDSLLESDVDSIDFNDSELESIDSNFDSIRSSASDWDWADRTLETSPTIFLDEGTLLQIKNNDPSITSLFVTFGNRGPSAAAINWQVEADAFAENCYLEKVKMREFGNDDIPSDILDGFAKAVVRCRSIKHFHIYEINYTEWLETLSPLFVQLRVIILDDCGVGDMSDHLLASSISKCIHLEQLSLRDNGILDHSSAVIFNSLAIHCSVVHISMENNKVGTRGCNALSILMQKPQCKLEVLNLSMNDIRDEGGDILSKAMANNRTLKKLSIGGQLCEMHERGWRTMIDNLRSSSSMVLEDLDFCANQIDDDGLVSLGGVLANTTSMRSLDIGFSLSVRDAASWRAFFRHTGALTKLSLHSTKISDEGMSALAGSLVAGLKHLNLTNCQEVHRTGWQSLFRVLGNSNCALEHLVLSRNRIGDESMTEFGNALSRNTSLKKLFLEHMEHTSSAVWLSFIHSIQDSDCSVEELSLLENDFDNDDLVPPLAHMLSNNTNLKMLYIDTGAGTTHPRWLVIADVLCNTSSIINTYRSNHTLEEISENSIHETFIPRRLKSLLRMNAHTSKSEVARRKILRYHVYVDEAVDVEEFLGMDLQVLPQALAWMCRDNRGYPALFSLLRSLPFLLGPHGMVSATGAKRKREEE